MITLILMWLLALPVASFALDVSLPHPLTLVLHIRVQSKLAPGPNGHDIPQMSC